MRHSDVHDLFFLGPKSELRAFLKELLDLVVDDYIYWRRNFHPKDPPAIANSLLQTPEAQAYTSRFHQELFALISDLKLDVPFFSPRYMAHMVSEVALPGLVAYLATMLYNPNNVSLEASPVTVEQELEVGRQLAELFGFPVAKSFGHLCSGGTVANYESLWLNRTARFLPLAMALACRRHGLRWPDGLPREVWPLLNIPYGDLESLWVEFQAAAQDAGHAAHDLVRRYSVAEYGEADFRQLVAEVFGEPYRGAVVLLPETAHYCWRRSAGLLGYGRRNLWTVEVDGDFRMRPDRYRALLERCLEERRPVLQSVFVLGTTEFGSVDPIQDLLAERDAMGQAGLFSPVHIDAAYGGYFASIFRPGARRGPLADSLADPWLGPLEGACRALGEAESITVDPHKMGYCPYGAGAIVFRHGFLRDFNVEGAAYALDTGLPSQEDLGKFILEGSKPGAAAAAVWFNHRMMPLDTDGYGKILFDLCELAQSFFQLVERENQRLRRVKCGFQLVPLSAPETNIVCLMILPAQATALSQVDRLNRHLARRFGVRTVSSVQAYDYLVSKTRIEAQMAFLRQHPALGALEADVESVTVLRLVFMNRWVTGTNFDGKTYMGDFLATLVAEVEAFLTAGSGSFQGNSHSADPPRCAAGD